MNRSLYNPQIELFRTHPIPRSRLSRVFAEIKKYEINIADSIRKIQNLNFVQLPFLKKLNDPEKESQSDKSDNSIGNKVEDMMVIIDHYKKLKDFESDNSKDSLDDMEQFIEDLQ